MIEAHDLHVVFNRGDPLETRALNGVNLHIAKGAFVTLIGSNGAGKSSLLSAIAGEIAPSNGRLTVAGRPIARLSGMKRANLAARVFQDPVAGSCADLTIAENMALALKRGARRGWTRALAQARLAQFCDRVCGLGLGLEDRLDDPMSRLSGGQRQAISLLMATLAPCEVLLLDEPTAALDPRMAALVFDLARRLHKEIGMTALMVTHSMTDALRIGSRTIMLHKGRVLCDLSGEAREGTSVNDLLRMFRESYGASLEEDRLLLDG